MPCSEKEEDLGRALKTVLGDVTTRGSGGKARKKEATRKT
jgi:hypothetical protein